MVSADDPQLRSALQLVGALLEAERVARGWAGLSACVVLDQAIVWSAGYGLADVGAARPATPRTRYSIASITKLFTVTMLMQLRDAGRLHLDESVASYDPAFTVRSPFPSARPITFRQLASHTAGLPKDFPFPYWDDQRIPPLDQLLAALPRLEPAFPPMTRFKYSNVGMACLGHALELIAGQPYRDYVTEHILRPLGMERAGFDAATMSDDLALGYAPSEMGEVPERAPYFPGYDIGGLSATGGLYSSVEDIARFIALQFRDEPAGGAQILAGGTLREMQAPVLLRDGWERAVGLGWLLDRVGDETRIGHPGDHSGFEAEICLIPALKLGLAVFINSNGDLASVVRHACELLVPVARQIAERERLLARANPPAAWKRYLGSYGSIEIRLVEGMLVGHSPDLSGETVRFEPIAEPVFHQCGGFLDGERVVFEEDEHGQITGMRYNGFTRQRDRS